MTKLHDNFADAFDMNKSEKKKIGGFKVPPVESDKNEKLEDDFDFARDKIRSVTIQAEGILSQLVELISDNGEVKPQLFDSIAHLVAGITNSQKALIDLHNTKKNVEADRSKNKSEKPNTVNNNTFIGSTEELNKILEEQQKKK